MLCGPNSIVLLLSFLQGYKKFNIQPLYYPMYRCQLQAHRAAKNYSHINGKNKYKNQNVYSKLRL